MSKLESSINFATFRDFCYLFPKNKNPLKFKLKSSFSDSMKTIKISGVYPAQGCILSRFQGNTPQVCIFFSTIFVDPGEGE